MPRVTPSVVVIPEYLFGVFTGVLKSLVKMHLAFIGDSITIAGAQTIGQSLGFSNI
jgi:hypothetical protein